MNKKIVLNRMYNGDYLNDNLGHEIINLYQSDNGSHYIYLQHSGTFHVSQQDKVGCVLLVRSLPGRKMLEVLGKAEGITEIYHPKQTAEDQIKYIVENDVRYAGVLLNELFIENEYQYVYLTYKAERVSRPIKPLYVSFDKDGIDTVVLTENKQAKASLKQYIDYELTPNDYIALQEKINDVSLWNNGVDKVEMKDVDKRDITYFDICGVSSNELAFSNAFAFFMERYPDLLVRFAREELGCSFSTDFDVAREEGNIDLLVRGGNKIVVVENKVKSHINGLIFNRKSNQLDRTQLEKYYEFAKKEAKEKGWDTAFYLLTPNYNDIDLSVYKSGCFYKKIYYKQVYDFCVKQKEYKEDIYFRDFVNALYPHTKDISDDLYEDMKHLFLQRIKGRSRKS